MAEDKRISKRGVRAMMRPKPRRVQRRDPYAPRVVAGQTYLPILEVHGTIYYEEA